MAKFQKVDVNYRVPEGIHDGENEELYEVTWIETDLRGMAHSQRALQTCHSAEEAIKEVVDWRINQAREIAWYACLDGLNGTYKVKDEGEVLRGVEVMAIVDGAVKMYATGYRARSLEA